MPEDRRDGLYAFIRQELKAGRQAYIVCPLVEEGETGRTSLMAVKSHARAAEPKGLCAISAVGLTYGTQPAAGKQAAHGGFRLRESCKSWSPPRSSRWAWTCPTPPSWSSRTRSASV